MTKTEVTITPGGLVYREDGRSCRVTSIDGVWGYWENGRRTEAFDSREDAARGFLSE